MIGYVYVIRSHQTEDVYYGSTETTLAIRMDKHKGHYKCWLNEKFHYITSFEILKYEDAYIELIEEVHYENELELIAREGHHIRNNICVNKQIPNRTVKEWRSNYYQEHKEEQRQYQLDNKVKIKDYLKQYNIDNADKIKEQKSKKHNCVCGGNYTHNHIARHLKTQKHINFNLTA
jgi:hypothetical protein